MRCSGRSSAPRHAAVCVVPWLGGLLLLALQDLGGGKDGSDNGEGAAETKPPPPPPRPKASSAMNATTRESGHPVSSSRGPAESKPTRSDPEREERERGNLLFGRGDFEGAIKSYTRLVLVDVLKLCCALEWVPGAGGTFGDACAPPLPPPPLLQLSHLG